MLCCLVNKGITSSLCSKMGLLRGRDRMTHPTGSELHKLAVDLGKSCPKSELSCCCCWHSIWYFCFNPEFVMVCSSVVNYQALFVTRAADVVRSSQQRAESLRFLLWLYHDWNCAHNHAECVDGSGIPCGHCLNFPVIGESSEAWAAWTLY